MDGIIFAYIGPETVLPLTSVLATVVGIFMMLGRNTFRVLRGILRPRSGVLRRPNGALAPHFSGASPARRARGGEEGANEQAARGRRPTRKGPL